MIFFLDMYSTQVLTFTKKRKFSRSSTYNLDSPWALLQICYLILFSPFFCLPTIMYVCIHCVFSRKNFLLQSIYKKCIEFQELWNLVKLTFTFRVFRWWEYQQFISIYYFLIENSSSIGIPKNKINKIENTTSDYKDKLTIWK